MSDNSSSSIFKITLNLTVACALSGVIIAIVNYLTADTAIKAAAELKIMSMKSLVLTAKDFKAINGKEGWFEAVADGKTVAYIVPSESKGFGGTIKLLTAVSPDCKVMNFTIVTANETPGLGDKASAEPFKGQFAGKTAEHLKVTKNPADKEDILAITGATITSRAVTAGVKDAVEKLSEFLRSGK